jgi:hypothetical protein
MVADIPRSLKHYVGQLGFECRFMSPDQDPFFAIVGRTSAQIMLKAVGDEVSPLPNHQRHEWARWDAFIYTSDPDSLAREFVSRNVSFHQPLGDTAEKLRGFETADPDGYVCFFGRPE